MDRLTEFKEIMMETMSPVASEMLCDICIHYSDAIAKHPFCGGDTAAKKQIGNAVPPALAEALYRAVLSA